MWQFLIAFLLPSMLFAQDSEKTKSQISQDDVLSCAAEYYLSLNRQGKIDAEFALNRTISNQSLTGTIQVDRNDIANSSSAATSETIAQAKLSKYLVDFALSKQINSLQKNTDSQKFEVSSGVLEYLKNINGQSYEFLILQQDKNSLISQVTELKKLRDYSEKLSAIKVIDHADFLLLQDSYNRTQLLVADVDSQIKKYLLALQTEVGFKFDDITFGASPSDAMAEALKLQILKHPLLRSSQLKIESLKYDLQSTDRDWWPKLSAVVGLNQQLTQSNLISRSDIRPFIGLSLSMNLNYDLHTAQKNKALQSINQLESQQKNILLREKQTIESNQLELASLKNKKTLTIERLENLNTLYQLQLTKFKAGRLSFFQLKDIEGDLFDAKRLAIKLELLIAKLNSETQLYNDYISKGESFFLKTKCRR